MQIPYSYKSFTKISIVLLMLIFVVEISAAQSLKKEGPAIIPMPLSIQTQQGQFTISATTRIKIDLSNRELRSTAAIIAKQLEQIIGSPITVIGDKQGLKKNVILLTQNKAPDSLNSEGYILTADEQKVVITGRPAGLFYGTQTLLQLMPAGIKHQKNIPIPAVKIVDKPRFGWRGMMLDVGRQFYSVEYVKKFIDNMAFHKLNTFHWHLVEDAGWRIEIKKYPKLTSVGAYKAGTQWGRNRDQFDNTPNGGFYTQEQVKDVVAYAAARYITIIPEIEMPGHTLSSLAAYPEFSCTGGPFEVSKYWVRVHDIYCAGNDKTFDFLEDVLTEVAALFPSPYIHIGGDEAPKTRWKVCPKCQARIKQEGLKDENELQSYFIKRIENFLLTKNKRIIGWDEILEGGLAPNAAVMSWRGIQGGITAAKLKHDVVMTPTTYLYLDYPQGERVLEGEFGYGPVLDLEKVYSYDPIPAELAADEVKYIKGVQANVWSEFIHTPQRLEYMTYPRGAALAEIAWTYPQNRSWEGFKKRLESEYKRYDAMGISYAASAYNVKRNMVIDSVSRKATVTLKTDSYDPHIYYTTDGSTPGKNSNKYTGTLQLNIPATLKAVNITDERQSKVSDWDISITPPAQKK
ncbi:beta-N-acetylhexosaminidase [Mucilaginibacter sp. AW1-3]